MMEDITREECRRFVISELLQGNPIVMMIFNEIAEKQTWITADTYNQTAEIIFNNIDYYG
jgi:hypothetical protein